MLRRLSLSRLERYQLNAGSPIELVAFLPAVLCIRILDVFNTRRRPVHLSFLAYVRQPAR